MDFLGGRVARRQVTVWHGLPAVRSVEKGSLMRWLAMALALSLVWGCENKEAGKAKSKAGTTAAARQQSPANADSDRSGAERRKDDPRWRQLTAAELPLPVIEGAKILPAWHDTGEQEEADGKSKTIVSVKWNRVPE